MKKSLETNILQQRVLEFIHENELTSEGKVVVAVSGGPDSVCLLHTLFALKEKLNITLHVAHLNHQLRGAESDADAECVAKLANELNLPCTIESRDVKTFKSQKRLTMEEAAREVRYNFLMRVAASINADSVTVGHTANDNIETILMHLIRGTGTRGLVGLKPCHLQQSGDVNFKVIRPLLNTSRQETVEYCRQHQLLTCNDSSNMSLSPLRNRIRLQLLPLLESYNPRIKEVLLRTAKIAGDEQAYLDRVVDWMWKDIARNDRTTITLDKMGLIDAPDAIKRLVLRRALEESIGNLMDIESRHIEKLMTALDKQAGKKINLPGGLVFTVDYDRFLIGPESASLSPFPAISGEYTLKIPGRTMLPGWSVSATLLDSYKPGKNDPMTSDFDYAVTGNNLLARVRRTADRFQPLGMDKSKKLGAFMIDARIPARMRKNIPLVCSPECIIWVVSYRIDEAVKVTAETKKVLRLKFTRR